MTYFAHIGRLILQNTVSWFVYQNESGKENDDLLIGQGFCWEISEIFACICEMNLLRLEHCFSPSF